MAGLRVSEAEVAQVRGGLPLATRAAFHRQVSDALSEVRVKRQELGALAADLDGLGYDDVLGEVFDFASLDWHLKQTLEALADVATQLDTLEDGLAAALDAG